MPKPSFLQSVLGKPSRSYADPNGPSPWAHDAPDDYAASSSRSHRSNNMYEHDHAYASSIQKGPRRARSVVFEQPQQATYNPHRFPQPAKKARSTLQLRQAHPVLLEEEGYPSRPASALSNGTENGVVKRKKKKRVEAKEEDMESAVSRTPRTSRTAAAPTRSAGRREMEPESVRQDAWASSSVTDLPLPPSFASRNHAPSESSSSVASSSSYRPYTPVDDRHAIHPAKAPKARVQAVRELAGGGIAPPTPPISEPSSSSSRETAGVTKGMDGLRLGSTGPEEQWGAGSRDGERQPIAQPGARNFRAAANPAPEVRIEPTPGVSTPTYLGPPVLNIQPPTPAPLVDPEHSPFHSERTQAPILALGAEGARQADRPPVDTHMSSSSAPPKLEQDASSDHGEDGSGSDDDSAMHDGSAAGLRGRHKSRTSISLPGSRPHSVASQARLSAMDDRLLRQSLSRQSTSNAGDGDQYGRRSSVQQSEVSFGGRSAREGSIRSSVSGFGKGGWAVAAASSQSGRDGQGQMFLPTGANSGWSEFQVPIAPPPRQSKFTPLPAAYQQPSFDRLVNSDRAPNGSANNSSRGSRAGRPDLAAPINHAPVYHRQDSAASKYSQDSASESESEDDAPKPSRSYAQQVKVDYERQTSQPRDVPPSPRRHEFQAPVEDGEKPSRRYTDGPFIPPKDPRRNSLTPRAVDTARFPANGLQSGVLSRASHSEVDLDQHETEDEEDDHRDLSAPGSRNSSSPPSPVASRPGSVLSRPMSPSMSMYEREAFPRPAFLDPDVLTILPEMTPEDSERLYRPPSPSERDAIARRKSWKPAGRAKSALGQRNDQSEVESQSIRRPASVLGFQGYARSEISFGGDDTYKRRSKFVLGFRNDKPEGSQWGGSSHGDGVLMQSDGRGTERAGGYSSLVLPAGAYVPSDPNHKRQAVIDARVLGLPHTAMAALCLSQSAHRLPMTPLHLRGNLPSPVDFTSHIKPPTKVGSREILIQVYAVAVDSLDVLTVEEKGKGDIGKWVPGRSFVGRCLSVGGEEKEIVRGEIVLGLLNIRKSGALAEYILCDRRHVTRAPHPTHLSLEQLALLPLYGVPAARAVRGLLTRNSRALIMEPHEGVAALICQEMSRAGVNVTALIGGGEAHHETQTRCLEHGARGVLTGAPAAVMLGLDEEGWDVVVDTSGTQRVHVAARRMLRDGGKLISLVEPDLTLPAHMQAAAKPSGFRTLRAAFTSRRKDSKFIQFEYISPAGSGEAEVDAGGMDIRDILEEPCMTSFRPPMPADGVWAFERGMEAFKGDGVRGTSVIRIIN